MKYTTDQDLNMGKWLGGAVIGALVMYLLDPDRGAARRALSGQRLHELGHQTGDVLDKVVHGIGNMASEAGPALHDAADKARASLAPLAATPASGGWGKPMRGAAVAGGSALGLFSLLSPRTPVGLGLGLAGLALIARGASNRPLGSIVSSTGAGMPMAFASTLHVDAAPEQVFDLFANPDNYTRFMSNVIEVRDLGNRRWHWRLRGAEGTEFAWDAAQSEQDRPRRLAWHSEGRAALQQSGTVECTPERGGTSLTVRLMYWPPAGGFGPTLAAILGSDHKRQFEDDLARAKSLVERGAVPPPGARPAAGDGKVLH